ncbi:MAG: hypothetical protein KGL52_04755 [Rhodospirillales bacterium]|nr:hypothetical protein [Rhodospirillales bacterium]
MTPDPIAAPPPALLRIPAAVRFSGISRSELYRLAGEDKLTMRKLGRSTLIDAASLQRVIDGLPVASIRPQRRIEQIDARPTTAE